jgi:hypothetical protein
LPTRVTVAKPEPVFANFSPIQLPNTMLAFDLRKSLTAIETLELRKPWAFVELGAYTTSTDAFEKFIALLITCSK